MSKDTSGSAFPVERATIAEQYGSPGLTKREWYAGLAMSNRYGPRGSTMPFDELAKLCFLLADAMIEEGSK